MNNYDSEWLVLPSYLLSYKAFAFAVELATFFKQECTYKVSTYGNLCSTTVTEVPSICSIVGFHTISDKS